MYVRHESFEDAASPVIRTVIRIYDHIESPLGPETFTNVEQEDQRADFARLALQPHLYLLFYDENLNHRLTKGMDNADSETIVGIVEGADRIRARIPASLYDFDQAKAEIVSRTEL